jgi:hypothetical protein
MKAAVATFGLNRALLILLCATGTSWLVGESGGSGAAAAALLLALAALKSRLVIDEFMGLRGVELRWRVLMFGWLALVLGLIALGYWKASA